MSRQAPLPDARWFANPPDIGLDMVGFRCAGDVGR